MTPLIRCVGSSPQQPASQPVSRHSDTWDRAEAYFIFVKVSDAFTSGIGQLLGTEKAAVHLKSHVSVKNSSVKKIREDDEQQQQKKTNLGNKMQTAATIHEVLCAVEQQLH